MTITTAPSILAARAGQWLSDRAPFISRAHHRSEVRRLAQAVADLFEAVQRAANASTAAVQMWERAAIRYRRERDEAREEVDRLRATVASFVISGARQESRPDH
jgi:hypothetical protein